MMSLLSSWRQQMRLVPMSSSRNCLKASATTAFKAKKMCVL